MSIKKYFLGPDLTSGKDVTITSTMVSNVQNSAFDKLRETYMQDLMMNSSMAAQQQGLMTGAATITGGVYASNPPNPSVAPLPTLRMSDLDSLAGKATLDELEEIWRARWGTEWVKRSEISDEFYNVAAVRLTKAWKLEVHELADFVKVYRLK